MKNILIHLFFILFFAGALTLENQASATAVPTSEKQAAIMASSSAQSAKIQSHVDIEFEGATPVESTPWDFLKQNWGILTLSLMTFLEVLVRLTPTENDNSIFSILNTIISALIPNLKKGGGTF